MPESIVSQSFRVVHWYNDWAFDNSYCIAMRLCTPHPIHVYREGEGKGKEDLPTGIPAVMSPSNISGGLLQEGFLAEDDFGAHDDYQRELDEEAAMESERVRADQLNAAENVAGLTLLQGELQCLPLSIPGFSTDGLSLATPQEV